ncbi:c-type cytochrome [Aureimonas sp. AU40]|uniref:c-type cytochrome n=1 Tax=Aureimonas sp. AU40 TaxID=1637747 RepID=UPI0007818D47|nr:cytochrome c [Aureimonas sp. AU40]
MRRAIPLLTAVALAGCSGQDMQKQPSLRPYEASTLWHSGTSWQPLPEGVVASGAGARLLAIAEPPPLDRPLVERGERMYRDLCAPCHGLAGDGDGIVVKRGFSPPPSYHSARLRTAPASHFVEVIGQGYGAMLPYGDRVEPRDRWAIAAYIRALQLSRDAPAADVPDLAEALR